MRQRNSLSGGWRPGPLGCIHNPGPIIAPARAERGERKDRSKPERAHQGVVDHGFGVRIGDAYGRHWVSHSVRADFVPGVAGVHHADTDKTWRPSNAVLGFLPHHAFAILPG